MIWRALAICFLFAVCWYAIALAAAESAPAPDPAQKRPDIFPCVGCSVQDVDGNGVRDMQDLNPTTRKAKSTRSIAYRVVTLSGCSAGRMPADLDAMNAHIRENVGLNIVRNDVAYDFTVYISCGLTQINKCGSTNVFCLPDGFPYNTDVYMSDVLSGYEAGSRLGIPLHEIAGHAVGTWGEQYQADGAFSPTVNLYDFMNTGPLSRHGFSASELGRWERTMWALVQEPPPPVVYPFWDGATWHMCDPALPDAQCYWAFYVPGDQWYDKFGRPEWGPQGALADGSFEQYNWRLGKMYRGGFKWTERLPDGSYTCLSGCW